MVSETSTDLDPGWGELIDIDVLDSSEWVGVFRDGQRLVLRTAADYVEAPPGIQYPPVRWLDRGRCVLVDSRTQAGQNNGWILRPDGRSDAMTFFAGDGIQDVLASGDRIVVTYFDEGVFSSISPGEQGIGVFDGRGRFCAGYQAAMGKSAVDVSDCYAASWVDESHMAFLPYTDFPFVIWDVRTFEHSVSTTPSTVHGSSALTVSSEGVLFFGPYDRKSSIFKWSQGAEASVVGQHPGPLRGLRGGAFLAHGISGFTVVSCGAAQSRIAGAGGGTRRS